MPKHRAIATVLTATAAAIRRFPFVVAAGMAATAGGFAEIGPGEHPEALRLLATATLALPLLFTVTILAERRPVQLERWLMFGVAFAVLALFWRAWSDWTPGMRGYRYMQLSGAFHLLAASAPFIRSRSTNGFWQYNQTLFIRFLTAALYALVLYIGLAVALAAIEKLFGAHLPTGTYLRLFYVLAFVFGTCVFVGGVPREMEALETETNYPNGLRAFTQFVLVPLVAIYLVILTVYLVKIGATQEWPSGWIGYLVSSVAVVGILSWLLVQPLEERPEYGWVQPFTKGFYVALLPAIFMLWLAIWKRVHQYGVTEERYALIVLSVWLAFIAVWYVATNSRNIKLIPASLCVIALVTFAGPTGAYAVSRSSQLYRLRAVLERDSILVGGKLRRIERVLPDSDRVAISSGFDYLVQRHGYRSVEAWLPDSLHRVLAAFPDSMNRSYDNRSVLAIMSTINVAFTREARKPKRVGDTVSVGFYSSGNWPPVWEIGGFTHDVHVMTIYRNPPQSVDTIEVDAHTTVHVLRDAAMIRVLRDGQSVIDIPLQAAIDSAAAVPRPTSPETPRIPVIRIEAAGGGISAVAYITNAQGSNVAGKLKLTSLSGELLLKLR